MYLEYGVHEEQNAAPDCLPGLTAPSEAGHRFVLLVELNCGGIVVDKPQPNRLYGPSRRTYPELIAQTFLTLQ